MNDEKSQEQNAKGGWEWGWVGGGGVGVVNGPVQRNKKELQTSVVTEC